MNNYKTSYIQDLDIPDVSELNLEKFDKYESSLDFSNYQHVKKVLLQHFSDGDHDTFFELLSLFINHVGKTKIARETNIPERTIYNFIKGDHKTSSENVFKVMRFISNEVHKITA
ncbi:MAG: hypothetical protein H8D23_11485 [Candidatus Brocadiales bacterium]|nr:hypothetical protein [Candidatus Brocadiales bacterium]